MGSNPEEVTDESSQVEILDPSNPVFTWPNKITAKDFENWVEERGSKFLESWDAAYEPLLETHDPGQAPQKGGLVYAKYGKGVYIYNAYAFYRHMPEGERVHPRENPTPRRRSQVIDREREVDDRTPDCISVAVRRFLPNRIKKRLDGLVAPRVFVRHLLGSRFVQLHFLFGLRLLPR